MDQRRRFLWGGILVVLGLMLLLDNLGQISFHEIIHTYWPAIFVLWGVWVLMKNRSVPTPRMTGPVEQQPASPDQKQETLPADEVQYSNVFGDVDVRITSSRFKGGSISTVFGDTIVDLMGATLADGECSLRLSGVFGDILVQVPSTIEVAAHASALFGTVQTRDIRKEGFSPTLDYQSAGYATAPRKIRIHASQVFGDIRISG